MALALKNRKQVKKTIAIGLLIDNVFKNMYTKIDQGTENFLKIFQFLVFQKFVLILQSLM